MGVYGDVDCIDFMFNNSMQVSVPIAIGDENR